MRRKTGVTVTGLVLALVMGGSVAAVADGDGGGKTPPPSASGHKGEQGKEGKGGKESGDQWLAALAKRYNVSKERLESALRDLKIALGDQGRKPTDPAVVAGLAKTLGISEIDASRLIKEVFLPSEAPGGKKRPGKHGGKKEEGRPISSAVVAKALAEELGIPLDRAKKLVADLDENGDDDAKFAAIAKGLGMTPERLADGLKKVKDSLDGAERPKSASPKPYKR